MPSALASPDLSSYSDPSLNKLFAAASNDPNAALQTAGSALGVARQGTALQQQNVQLSQEQFNLAKSKFDALHQIYGSLVADPSSDNVNTQIGEAVRQGVIDPQTGMQAALHFAQLGGDPAKIRQEALNGLNVNATHHEVLSQTYGDPGTINTGGKILSTVSRIGPNAGTTATGDPSIPITLSPGQKTGFARSVDPSTGAGQDTPIGTLFDDRGNPRGQGYKVDTFGAIARGQGAGAPAAPPPAAPISFGGLAAGGAQGQGGTVTPSAQNMPVVTVDAARAALARIQGGQSTPADRNTLRGYAVQNNRPLGGLGDFEPQPAVPGATVPPQPTGQGDAPMRPVPGQPGATTRAPAPEPTVMQAVGGGATRPVAIASAPTDQDQGQPAGGPTVGRGGTLTTSLSPGQAASLAAGANGYGALSSDVASPQGVQQRTVQLRTALNALRGTNTGLGTAGRQQLVGYLASLPGGLGKYLPGVDPDSATDYDIASKYLNAYALNTPGAARSDAGLSTAQSANANTSGMMKAAAVDVTLQNIGMENGKRALLNAFNASGADPGQFGRFASSWSQNTDPRAFALGDMTPAERAKLVSGLQGPAKAAFLGSVRKGIAAGVLTPDDLKGASGNGQ